MKVFYIPCPDQLCAEKICEELLKDKLIGCGNILPHMTSMYWWEGKIEKSLECVLILKTSIQAEVLEKKNSQTAPIFSPLYSGNTSRINQRGL